MKKKNYEGVILVLDVQKVYHSVIRNKLFNIIRDKDILSMEESLFLSKIYNNLYY